MTTLTWEREPTGDDVGLEDLVEDVMTPLGGPVTASIPSR
jgi:hypothetical protein